jgi:uncharacterized protein (DUF1800 family)
MADRGKVKVPGAALAAVVLAAPAASFAAPQADPAALALVNRLTWGVSEADAAAVARLGSERWLERQLHPSDNDALPPDAQAQIAAMAYLHRPLADLVVEVQAKRKVADALTDPDQKRAARQALEAEMNDAARQAAARSILRDLYSPDQLREQMTWFWFNHFNVQQAKSNIRLMVGDYEDRALRPHALGRFRDLLEATLRHPAMLRYLDNADNAAGHINENYAREIMELHTMGVGSGYSQKDVQELARILTGVGIDTNSTPPKLPLARQGLLVRDGLFEFNPNRHDFGDKVFLGHVIKGQGFAEVEAALDILARQPATAHHISRQLAVYFVADNPPEALVSRMSDTWRRTDGDIAQVLATMVHSREFKASLGGKFKDPTHYVISAVRLAYGDRVILNAQPIQAWLGRLGEGLYSHETPDGYAMTADAWDGPGQMDARFELARQVGSGAAGLYRPDAPGAKDQPAFPNLQNALYYQSLAPTVPAATKAALAQATSPQDWNTLYLSAPDFMRR